MKIKTEKLQASLGGSLILKGVDLEIPEKAFVGIIGPNGSGKSTLLKCIYRVLKPNGGTVFLNEKPLSSYTVRQSAQEMAVVAQHNSYNFDFTVQDMVQMGRAPHKRMLESDNESDRRLVEDALDKVGLAGFASRNFSTLSGGEQQRVILARALAQQTSCLLLDEPTNHLDIKHQLQLMDIVKNMDLTIVSAIHDLNIAAMYCDLLYVLQNGSVVCSGPPHEILTPALLRDIYEVNADIWNDPSGQLHILYRSWGNKSRP